MKNNKKGFTLAELLIVVAIIAVLTAVAVPIFNTQLEKSREETDIANMRAAKAAAVAYFLDNVNETEVFFDANQGAAKQTSADISTYGKGTTTDGHADAYPGYTNTNSYNNGQICKVVKSSVTSNTEGLTVQWVVKN